MNTAMIKNQGKVINKLALVLLTIVVLELVLIGDQVQPVKAIKKKIFIKKLKKLLPILALIKPKKKIILLPIPIPMFKNQGPHGRPVAPMPYQPPMSFMMMGSEQSQIDHQRPNMVGVVGPMAQEMMPMSMIMEPQQVGSIGPAGQVGVRQPAMGNQSINEPPASMLMPSMTMSIQSDSGGGSAIELSTSMMSPNASLSGNLLQRPPQPISSKWRQPQQVVQQQFDLFDEPPAEQYQQQPQPQQQAGGEHYYSSPWTAKQPLSSPAKLFRGSGARLQTAPQSTTRRPQQVTVMVVRDTSARRPEGATTSRPPSTSAPIRQQPQHEYEELVPVGPQQMIKLYQTPDGQLHMSPPPSLPPPPPPPFSAQPLAPVEPNARMAEGAQATPAANLEPADELGGEVQTSDGRPGPSGAVESVTHQPQQQQQQQKAQQATKGGRQLASPAVKGKQRQFGQQQSSKRKEAH